MLHIKLVVAWNPPVVTLSILYLPTVISIYPGELLMLFKVEAKFSLNLSYPL